jgi:T-complex protein 1 subunit eta
LLQQAPVILLKEGTDTSQGIPQIVSNINACQAIADAVRTTLGPRGMDKLIVDDRGTISQKVPYCIIYVLHVGSK